MANHGTEDPDEDRRGGNRQSVRDVWALNQLIEVPDDREECLRLALTGFPSLVDCSCCGLAHRSGEGWSFSAYASGQSVPVSRIDELRRDLLPAVSRAAEESRCVREIGPGAPRAAVLAAPLRTIRSRHGILFVVRRPGEPDFSREEEYHFTQFADRIAVRLDRMT